MDQSRVPLVGGGGATYLVGQMKWVGDGPISLVSNTEANPCTSSC